MAPCVASLPIKVTADEITKIFSYVKNRLDAGNPPTLKEIQSRHKGTKLRCKDIANVIAKESSGAVIVNNAAAFSLSEVTSLGAPAVKAQPVTVFPASLTGLMLYPYGAFGKR